MVDNWVPPGQTEDVEVLYARLCIFACEFQYDASCLISVRCELRNFLLTNNCVTMP
jgi:hypothetical protein